MITGKEHFQVEFQRACRISTEYIPSMMLILRQKIHLKNNGNRTERIGANLWVSVE